MNQIMFQLFKSASFFLYFIIFKGLRLLKILIALLLVIDLSILF